MIRIDDRSACSGCAACANLCPQKCISMVKDKMGFAYPAADITRCVDCGACERSCPLAHGNAYGEHTSLTAYAAQNPNDEIRRASSSGGIFTNLAQYILSQNGVVFGAAFDNRFREVKHIAVQAEKDLCKIRGSKYVQSDVGSSYQAVKDFLEQRKLVLFSGTLCQTVGLQAFLRKSYPNLYLADVVCYGVPAPDVWSAYLDHLEKKYNGEVIDVSFRDKRNGWGDYVISVKFDNGKEYINPRSKDLYIRGFLHEYYLRPSCYRCKYKGLNNSTDITLGDLWGIEHIAPELNDDKGTSLVILSSEKGRALFEKAVPKAVCKAVRIEDAVKYNPSVEINSHSEQNQREFERDFGNEPIKALLNRYCSNSIFKKIIRKIKSGLTR